MVISLRPASKTGTSLKSLINGFVLTKQTEGKSSRTVDFYSDNLKRFLWYAVKQEWSDDIRTITEWSIREFLGYVGSQEKRWGTEGNGSETSKGKASFTTVHHYFVVLANFFGWTVREGFLDLDPTSKIKMAKPKEKVIKPYSQEELLRMLSVCEMDYEGHAKFLGSRNKAITLVLVDSGVRLSELQGMTLEDVNTTNGNIKVLGKGNKERIVRIGKVTQKAVWRYLIYRPEKDSNKLWLNEEGKPLTGVGIQSLVQRLKVRANVGGTGSVHRFRHTFALNFLRADKNVFNLQYLLGHSQLEMVRRYTSTLGMEDALKALERVKEIADVG